jgi:hypothetical protein
MGLAQAGAATNYWVQPANVAWTVYGASNFKATVPTKVLINLMSKVTITNYAAGTVTSSNSVTPGSVAVNTNAEAIVGSNTVLGAIVPTNLPPSFVYTNVATNGSNSFTNTVTFTETVTSPVTYTFNNTLPLGTNPPAYIITNLFTVTNAAVGSNAPTTTNVVAPYLTVAVETNGQYSLSYSMFVPPVTNIVFLTNYPSTTTPDFAAAKSAKLFYVTPIVNGTNLAPLFWVVTGSGKNAATNDVTGFFNRGFGAIVKQSEKTSKNVQYAFSELLFATPDGTTSLDAMGFDTQTLKVINSKKPAVTTTVPILSASKAVDVGDGQINFGAAFNGAVVLNGTIAISSGKLQ